jgi:O-antigen ligase
MKGLQAILADRGQAARLGFAILGSAFTLAILSVSILHWGGVYPLIGSSLHLAGGGLWLVLAGLALINFLEKKPTLDVIDVVAGAFLFYAAWRYATTPVEYTGRLEWLWILTYAALFFFVRYGLPNRHWAMVMLSILIALAVASCIYALIHRNNPTHLIWGLPRPNYGPRISGTFGCPNHFANLMVMATLCCLFVGSYSRIPWPLRIFLYYLSALLTCGLYFSVSRGAYFAWIAGMGVVAWFLFRNAGIRWWWKLSAFLVVVVGVVVVISKNPFIMDRLDQMTQGIDVRLQLSVISKKLWEMSPWWGSGIGSYDYFFLRAHGPELQSRALYAHCDYFNTLVDYGAVGLGLILIFITCVIVEFRRKTRSAPHERDLLLLRLGWAALAAMAVHSIFDFSLHIPACAVAFFIILGAALMRTHREEKHLPPSLLPVPFLAVGAILAIGAGAYTLQAARTTHSALRIVPLKAADFASLSVAEIAEMGEKAFAADPRAYPLLMRIGDALRVKASKIDGQLSKASSDEAPALLRERENCGRLSLMFYQRAHRSAPLEDTLLVKQGMILDILQRHVEAGLAYAEAIQNQPDNRYFRFNYGLHLLETGQRLAAREQIEHAAAMPLDPREDPTLRATARIAMETLRSYENP